MDVAGIADWFTDPARQWLSSRHSREQVKHALWICQLASAITWPVDIEVAGYLHLPFPNLLGQPLGHDTDVDFSSFQLHMLRVTLRGLLYTHLVVLRDVLQDFVRAIETLVRHGLYPHPDSLLYSVFATKGIARVLEFYLEKRLEQYHHVPTGPLKFPVNRPPSPSYGQLLPEDVEAYKNFCKNVGDETYLATQGTLAPLRPWMQYRRLSKYLETFRPLLGMWGKCWKVSETVENPGVEVPGELAEEELVVQLEILGNRYGDAERPWNRL
ncbi:hypothetical protein B0A55_03586 [Friedmanniomyces simplex]|uniref:Uncharacterized protein n=1 Tax=Friedmanniomyces simplex TaxID=329884 RepID=A0A4V5NH04_9PEZI|nr:hypothetical protein B0A55_03586 [Friedmanniomyces simplex]